MCDLSSSEEVEVVSRGCWAEQPQPCSGSLFKERHFSYSPEFWSQSGAPGPDASSSRQICGPSFSLDSLRLKRPAAYGPGLLRAGPSGEERHTLQYTVPISHQCLRRSVCQPCHVQCSRVQRSPASAHLSFFRPET